MTYQFRLREQPFEFNPEFDDAEESDFAETWRGELSRKGSDYIRWVQESLNKILGLRLAIDGVMGAQTRSAIRSFQKQAGLSADGRVGKKTEAATIAKGADAPQRSAAMPVVDPNRVKLRKHKTKPGYIAYGGGSTTTVLRQLKNQGRLDISDGDIEMFHRMSNVETGGVIQGINSWDSAYMSMGFMQWPVLYDDKHGGKLQRLIQMVPEAFKRYGIELSNEKYAIRRRYGTEYSWKIKGAPSPEDLRSEIWAKRFYLAGLDPEVIVAEAKLALTVVREGLQKMILFAKQKTGDGQLFERIRAAYDNSSMLRALIQEAYNYRPAHTQVALKNAMLAVRSGIGAEELIGVLRQKLREAFPQDADSQRGVDHIITKTANYPAAIRNEFEGSNWDPATGIANVQKIFKRKTVPPAATGTPGQGRFSFSDFPGSVLNVLRKGLESAAVRLAIVFGFTDRNRLTNLVFFGRHPGLCCEPLKKGQKHFDTLSREWRHIQDGLVRPALEAKSTLLPGQPKTPTSPLRYGVPGGQIGSRFNEWREMKYQGRIIYRGYHLGIDVSHSTAKGEAAEDPRRGLPVLLTLKPSINAKDLNTVKVAYEKGGPLKTGLGISSRGAAILEQAKVIRTFTHTKPDNAYGGWVGIACIYVYTKNDGSTARFTLYIEFLHLITRETFPYTGEGRKISLEAWLASGKVKQVGFGPDMKEGRTFTAAQLTTESPLLVGYLGATRWPHVHIQVGFKHGVVETPITCPRVDPTIMVY